VGPRAGLGRYGKSRPPPGFDPQTVQPIARHYADCTARPTVSVVTVIIYLVSKFLDFLICSNHFFVAVCAGMSSVSMSYSHFVVIREVKKFSHMEVNVCYVSPRLLYVESSNAEAGTLS